MTKVKTTKTAKDWFEHNLKKLNYLRSLGFGLGLAQWDGENYQYIKQGFNTDSILDYMENEAEYRGNIFTVSDAKVMCIHCGELIHKLLNFKTLSIELPDYGNYCYIFKYDNYMFNKIQEFSNIENKCIYVVNYIDYYFTKRAMPRVTMPKDKELKLNNLPLMDLSEFAKLKEVCKLFNENKGAQFQINNGTKYRIPTYTLDMLSSPILTLNEKKVFEKVLLTITNSTFAITRSTSTPYRIKFKDFLKGLKLSRSSQTQKELVEECFQNLQKFNLMESYEIDKSGMLTFYATSLSEKIKSQNTQREFGFYNNVPKTKQNNIISAWLDYLYMIQSFTRHNKALQISLDSLLVKLELRHLQDKHRLGDIAKILNTLLEISNVYGLTKGECVFDTKIVKELFEDRQRLKKYIILSDNGEEPKENGNG